MTLMEEWKWENKVSFFSRMTGWNLNHPDFRRYYVSDDNDGKQKGYKFERILEIFKENDGVIDVLDELDNACRIKAYLDETYIDSIRFDKWINTVLEYNEEKIYNTEDVKDEKEVENMGLKIEKTDILTIDEFKENKKAYEKIYVKIDFEKYEQYEEDYGVEPFQTTTKNSVFLSDETIKFLPKAIKIYSKGCGGARSIPYEYITEIECIYYLSTEK